MPSKYTEKTLGEVAFVSSGKRPPSVSKERSPDALVPVVGGGGPSGFTAQPLTTEHVLITGRVGTLGKLHVSCGPVWPSDNALVIRPRQELVSFDYLRYALGNVIHFAIGMNRGAANPLVTQTDLSKLTIPVPAPRVQAEVAVALRSLDDRIDLLRQTNATLEAIAQALFKSWFIDFDPVHAKTEGREPEGMDAATAALFPAELKESALGLIPQGWRVGSVYEVASVIYGAPFASKQFNTDANGQPLVRIRDLRDEAPGVWTQEVHPKGYLLRPGDIVVGMDGEFRAYLWGGVSAWMNQRVCCFQPVAPHCAAFVRCAIAGPLAHIEATEVATTVIHLGKGDIDRFKVVVPPDAVASAFANLADPLYARIINNKVQSRHLSALRDALLPRLLSGKLRLPEAKEQVEDALA